MLCKNRKRISWDYIEKNIEDLLEIYVATIYLLIP